MNENKYIYKIRTSYSDITTSDYEIEEIFANNIQEAEEKVNNRIKEYNEINSPYSLEHLQYIKNAYLP
jgi:hypothetical protein